MINPSTMPATKATMPAVKSSDETLSPVLSKKELAFERRLSTLDKHNVTDDRLAKELDEGLKAEVMSEVINSDGTVTTGIRRI
jgi:hypothetical protein